MNIYVLAMYYDDEFYALGYFGYEPTVEEIARAITRYTTPPFDAAVRMQTAREVAESGSTYSGATQFVLQEHRLITKGTPMKTIEIIPWHATNDSTCPVDKGRVVTVWCKNNFLYRDRAEEFDWTSARENPIIAYARTPDEVFKRERWRAPNNCEYYYFYSPGYVCVGYDDYKALDDRRHTFGNYFRKEDQCAEAARRVQATLNAYHEELMRGEG